MAAGNVTTRWLGPAGVAVAALTVLAACGGGSSNNNAGSGSGSGGGGGTSADTVSVKTASGVGKVLTDSAGKTLYFSDEEKSGKIVCMNTCTSFWKPLTVTDKNVMGPSAVSMKLGTMKRPDDGKLQVTFGGKPLYTFKLDTSNGDVKGNNFSDDFGGTHFTWHAATTSGKAAGGGGSGGGSNNGNNGGGYNY